MRANSFLRFGTIPFIAMLTLWTGTARAGGPRFVASTSAANAGAVLAFRVPNPLYFTDPGDLAAGVSHAQADAAVAAAAAVWNVPTSLLVLAQGGTLSEHVSSGNTYFDGSGIVFPADVQASNYLAKPIAIVYDKDGSITDLLKGEGASNPSSCRQNSVTESVDAFGIAGTIDHAVMVINGRCYGPAHDQMMQLQYDVMRAFGRIVGVAWSQLNDNVFTGTAVTAVQMSYWPVMHPIDIVCGPYTYLCMQNPFVLRPDDLSALAGLYPVTAANLTAGKTLSSAGANNVVGQVMFADNYTAMDSVNVVVVRHPNGVAAESWQTASGISGVSFVKNVGNPVTGAASVEDFIGGWSAQQGGSYQIARVPQTTYSMLLVTIESINPLYSGQYALGPFERPPVSLSGAPQTIQDNSNPTQLATVPQSFRQMDSPTACPAEWGPYESSPIQFSATGFFNSTMCPTGSTKWRAVSVRSGRRWTIEAQALDEVGGHTMSKMQPVIGVWKSTDSTGLPPTVAAQPVPMNGSQSGLTQLMVPADTGNNTYRMNLSDLYGAGRPDFLFQWRVLYADSVAPASIPSAGGQITITGMGFAVGNRVLINGVAAKVISWTANTIVATAPSLAAAKATGGSPVDIEIDDMITGGVTVMTGALTYPGGGTRQLVQVSAPASLETGSTAATPFAVKVLAADGVTPVAGASVQLAVTGGATLAACGLSASCTVVTNSAGVAQTTVTGTAAGSVTLRATETASSTTLQVVVTDADPVRKVVIGTGAAYVAAGATVTLPVVLNAVQDNVAATGVTVNWTVAQGLSLSAASTSTDGSGAATVTLSDNALAAGTASVQACAWTTVCSTWTLTSVAASQWTPAVMSGAGQSVKTNAALAPVVFRVADVAGHPLAGAAVNVGQTVTAWEGACPALGRCPAAPVLAANQTTATSDASGLVSVTPLQVSGVPQTVNIAFATGTTGFLTVVLVKTP